MRGKPVVSTKQRGRQRWQLPHVGGRLACGGAVGRQVTIVADVVAVDPARQVITLKGPQRTVDLKVADPEQFKRIAKGDQVEATFTQALALAVEPAAKK